MNILDLPEEIIIFIIQKLDTKSCFVLYDTCRSLRQIVSMNNVVKELHFSLNTLATRESLKLDMLKNISGHLKTLNLSGVSNLNKTVLLPALKRMRKLECLNVAYTPIKIFDLLGVENHCTNLIDITINFEINSSEQAICNASECKHFFKNFKYIHFISSSDDLMYSTLSLSLLELADLYTINFTVAACQYFIGSSFPIYVEVKSLRFKNFNIYISHKYYLQVQPIFFKVLQEHTSEYIILCADQYEITKTFYSPSFERFFKDKAGSVSQIQERESRAEWCQNFPYFYKNYAIMLWSRGHVIDQSFYNQVEERLSKLPYTVKPEDSSVPPKNKWICVNEEIMNKVIEEDRPKRRCVQKKFALDFNKILNGKENVQLTVTFKNNYVCAKFPADCSYLKNLTYLCLEGSQSYDKDFFKCLIQNCVKLTTLSIISSTVLNSITPLSRLLPTSKSLRNFRLVSKNINLTSLCTDLMMCINFENIYIEDKNFNDETTFPDLIAILKKCNNLYNFVIVHNFSSNVAKQKAIRNINKYKVENNKSHLNVNIFHNREDFYNMPFHPCLEVFNVAALKK